MFCKIDSLYICVNDMERAIKFYEEFFEQEVSENSYVEVSNLIPFAKYI